MSPAGGEDGPTESWRSAAIVEGREFEEFQIDLERAFPEDEVTFDELVSMSPEELAERSGDEVVQDDAWDAAFGPDAADEAEARSAGSDGGRGTDDEGSGLDGDERSTDDGPRDLLTQFVDALATRELTDREREHLRAVLGVDTPNSTEVRIRHLQSRLADLEAYIDAIEAFVDERGTARVLLEDLERDLDSQASDLAGVTDAVDGLDATVADHRRRIETTDSRVGTVESRADDLEERTAAVEAGQRWMREAFAAAAEDRPTVETEN